MDQDFRIIKTKHILDIAGGDSNFLKEIIGIFRGQIPDFISKMEASLAAGDWTVLAREAHTAKSSALTFGMDETGVLLKKIQLTAQAGEYDALPAMVQEASAQLNAALPELEEFKLSLK